MEIYFTEANRYTENTNYPTQTPVSQKEVPGFASFEKGPSFSFPDFEIDGKKNQKEFKWWLLVISKYVRLNNFYNDKTEFVARQ